MTNPNGGFPVTYLSRFRHTALVLTLAACSRHARVEEQPATESSTMTMAGDDGMSLEHMHQAAHAAHMKLTAMRTPSHADSLRADTILATLRASIAKYANVSAAEADGYHMFAPTFKHQAILHYTNRRNAIENSFGFDASRPTSLLYKKRPDGSLQLVGAMYTAPKSANEDDLNARIPLSLTHWHQHVNICVPVPMDDETRWKERENGKLLFGPAGSIATEQACTAHNGKFRGQAFGWMVHVNAMTASPWVGAMGD